MPLKINVKPISGLRPAPGNERTHSDEQVRSIAQSIATFGFNDPIAITADGEIIEGVGRWRAAQEAGMDRVPTICLDHLTPAQRDAYRVAHNKLALLAGWDTEKLLATIEAVSAEDLSAALMGFNDDDLARMADDMARTALEDAAGTEGEGGITAGESSAGSAYDYVPFNVIMRKVDRDRMYEAITKAKAHHGLTKSDEALTTIANDWLARHV